ncbi:hypothetical protein O9G_002593 [Rozella allomycis CSF55]|uniref:Uncharacterized protein n=1 Tax=Rozella allomycis (strain CSF55) TaxID=988480 RepID=A0A075APM8_ROZAC|nr:hypothetical protein O9G_002593 [Rozella allomycis CSF55]|eukprot:EPZ32099.1 hypothetical protein O9G_002593 [Rozella allomycis CSF55]
MEKEALKNLQDDKYIFQIYSNFSGQLDDIICQCYVGLNERYVAAVNKSRLVSLNHAKDQRLYLKERQLLVDECDAEMFDLVENVEYILHSTMTMPIENWDVNTINSLENQGARLLQKKQSYLKKIQLKYMEINEKIADEDKKQFENLVNACNSLNSELDKREYLEDALNLYNACCKDEKLGDEMNGTLSLLRSKISATKKLYNSFLAIFEAIHHFFSGFEGDQDRFASDYILALQLLEKNQQTFILDLRNILFNLLCRMDVEVEYSQLESGLDEGEKLLNEYSNLESSVRSFFEMIPHQEKVLHATLKEKIFIYFGYTKLEPNLSRPISATRPKPILANDTRRQSLADKRHVSIAEESSLQDTEEKFADEFIEEDDYVSWVLQRCNEWYKFKTHVEYTHKTKRHNAFWYNTKHAKERRKSGAYNIVWLQPINRKRKDDLNVEIVIPSLTTQTIDLFMDTNLNGFVENTVRILRSSVLKYYDDFIKKYTTQNASKLNLLRSRLNTIINTETKALEEQRHLIEKKVYERRSNELMAYRRYFEAFDYNIKKTLKEIYEEKESIADKLQALTHSFFEETKKIQFEIVNALETSQVEECLNRVQGAKLDIIDKSRRFIEQEKATVQNKISYLDESFNSSELKIRQTCLIAVDFVNSRQPVYEASINSLHLLVKECSRTFNEDCRKWIEAIEIEIAQYVTQVEKEAEKRKHFTKLDDFVKAEIKKINIITMGKIIKYETEISDLQRQVEKYSQHIKLFDGNYEFDKFLTILRDFQNFLEKSIIFLGYLIYKTRSLFEDIERDVANSKNKLNETIKVYIEERKQIDLIHYPRHRHHLLEEQIRLSTKTILEKAEESLIKTQAYVLKSKKVLCDSFKTFSESYLQLLTIDYSALIMSFTKFYSVSANKQMIELNRIKSLNCGLAHPSNSKILSDLHKKEVERIEKCFQIIESTKAEFSTFFEACSKDFLYKICFLVYNGCQILRSFPFSSTPYKEYNNRSRLWKMQKVTREL